jgi:hypothetical protein
MPSNRSSTLAAYPPARRDTPISRQTLTRGGAATSTIKHVSVRGIRSFSQADWRIYPALVRNAPVGRNLTGDPPIDAVVTVAKMSVLTIGAAA